MMTLLLSIVRRLWLPIFLLSSLSWLLGPAFYHEHYGNLQLISAYEGGTLSISGVFRLADFFSALWLLFAVALFPGLRRDPWLMGGIIMIGLLAMVDVVFTDRCDVRSAACNGWPLLSTGTHIVESVLSGVVIFGLAVFHGRKYRQLASWLFVGLQVVLGLLLVSQLLSSQQVVVLQYIYELAVISWLGWLALSFLHMGASPDRHWVRRAFGVWAAMNGAFAIIVAVSHRDYFGFLFSTSLVHESALVGQHGVVAGVLMLYLARQVYRGERRAAIILELLFASEVIKYSVIAPSPILLGLNITSFVLLLYGRRVFDRNSVAPAVLGRLKDALTLASGVAVAVFVSLAITSLTGHAMVVRRSVAATYHVPVTLAERSEDHLDRVKRLHAELTTLSLATIVLVAWSIFRPARLPGDRYVSRATLQRILNDSGTSSEDYFKLWPSDKRYFPSQPTDRFVAYKVVGGTAFALADPVAPTGQQTALLDDFMAHCRRHGWSVCVLMVPETSKQLYSSKLKLLAIGSAAIINPAQFEAVTKQEKWWRWQRNRATKKGLHYKVLDPPHSDALLAEMRTVSDAWLDEGKTEQGFALGYFDVHYLQQCRLHALFDDTNHVVAFANELPVVATQRRRTIDLMRYQPDQDGAMPYLLACMIEHLANDPAVSSFDLGFVPLAKVDSPLLAVLRKLAASRYSSLGLEQFKNKFKPDWQSYYIAYDGDVIDLARVAINLETLLKRPTKKTRVVQ